jgi:hypothetical protein
LGWQRGWEERAGDQDEACELAENGHSISVKNVKELCRG